MASVKAVASRENPAFKALARLVASAAERRRRGLAVIDGAHLVAAYLDSGGRPETLATSRSGIARPEVARLAERAGAARVLLLADALFDSLSTLESASGVLAVVPAVRGSLPPPDADLVLLIEDVQDPGNVGTLLRSAAAAGVRHVILSPGCAFAWSLKTLRAGMGAHFALEIAESADLQAFLATYRGASVALAADAERSIYELDLRGPLAIAVGSEGAGLSAGLRAAATHRARIPMPGKAESLNAGVAGSLCLFEALRQRGVR